MANRIDIQVEIPPLPEGFSGTPDDFLTFFKENAIFFIDGTLPSGQIGGATPVENIGIDYRDDAVSIFRDGAYHPITDVPIGSCLPWASAGVEAPLNYFLCNGASKVRADYAELFAVVGTIYGGGDDTVGSTTFNLPDLRGRHPVGFGKGDYKKQDILTGSTIEYFFGPNPKGPYVGFNWVHYTKIADYIDHPPISEMMSGKDTTPDVNIYDNQSPAVVMQFIIRYR